jgi:hypothetical protein
MSQPHTNHNPERYWGGVAQLLEYSNFEQPRVSVRQGPAAIPPAAQPTISASGGIDSAPDPSVWRPDEQGV